MGKKRKPEWQVDDGWDESPAEEQRKDPFSLASVVSSGDEWGDDLLRRKDEKKNRLGFLNLRRIVIMISAVIVVSAVILVILGRGAEPGAKPDPAAVFTTVPPVETTVPPVETTVPPVGTTVPPAPPSAPQETTPPPDTEPPAEAPSDTPPAAVSALIENDWYGIEYRYYYQFLTDHEKEIFGKIYNGAAGFADLVNIGYWTDEECDHVFYVLCNDCPELFNISPNDFSYSRSSISLAYRMSREIYEKKCISIRSRLDSLMSSFSSSDGDFEKQLVFYRDVIDGCDYLVDGDATMYADACLYDGKSQCSGYADALALALRHAGIPCLTVSMPDVHAWNMVRINGEWYNCDATWDDTGTEGIRIPYDPNEEEYNGWMNMPDRIYRDDPKHQPEVKPGFPVPSADSIRYSYVNRCGHYIQPGTRNSADAIDTILKQAKREGKKHVLIMLDDPSFVSSWDSIRNDLYQSFGNYGWVFYPPEKAHRCIYAVYHDE